MTCLGNWECCMRRGGGTRAPTDLLLVQYFHGKVLLCRFVLHQHDPSEGAGAQRLQPVKVVEARRALRGEPQRRVSRPKRLPGTGTGLVALTCGGHSHFRRKSSLALARNSLTETQGAQADAVSCRPLKHTAVSSLKLIQVLDQAGGKRASAASHWRGNRGGH